MTGQEVFSISPDVISRELDGDIILVPVVAGVGDLEKNIFSLNETGRRIWDKIDGARNLQTIITMLADEFSDDANTIQEDVFGFVEELSRRKFINPVD